MRAYRHMVFVDGENLTIRAQESTKARGIEMVEGPYYRRDIFAWIPGTPATLAWGNDYDRPMEQKAIRAYYYTAVFGGTEVPDQVSDSLWKLGFDPKVFSKKTGARSKGVDITLTKDMLGHAFRDHYDIGVIVAGDGDYTPLVDEVKRTGKLVYVVFLEKTGLSQQLKLAADKFVGIEDNLLDTWKNRSNLPVGNR